MSSDCSSAILSLIGREWQSAVVRGELMRNELNLT
jgi:hypothetical protein